jgi:HEAT repeat protein
MAQNPDGSSLQTLVGLSRDAEPAVRSAAMSGLGQLGSPEAANALFEVWKRGAPEDRAQAIQMIAAIGDPRGNAVVASGIADPDANVAAAAIYAAQSSGSDLDDSIAARLADTATPEAVRMAAAQTLRAHGGPIAQAYEAQIAAVLGAEPPEVHYEE